MAGKKSSYLPGILWALFMMVLCGIPGSKFSRTSFWSFLPVSPDKLVHFFLHFVLASLLCLGTLRSIGTVSLRSYVLISVAGFLYGIAIELLQLTLFTSRGAEAMDVLANSVGTLLGCVTFAFLVKKYRLF